MFRPGHKCKSACIAVALLQYDALDSGLSAQAYSSITNITNANIGKVNFFYKTFFKISNPGFLPDFLCQVFCYLVDFSPTSADLFS